MSETFLVNEQDRPNLNQDGPDGKRHIPGVANAPRVLSQPNTITKFLGRLDGEGEGPWVFYKVQKKGDVVPFHRHSANRTEFVIEGTIEWREKGKQPSVYGAGTLSYVEAGVLYGYEVLEDARILIIFDKAPGFNAN
ncbi:cupin domain-containing protein [Novosphingobium album (ex Liu et al. 2023)]|uniref:Cupin domain-containing protein n=1 Tax=Novosphingobium album (ex Liu et al. 2023) TaxID=3031130 RepID=A0ABT5WXQ0_9SPHN|nr:cupin domain-containing protein [Novosphingobium album (ex Liu et al. 2023)]MDE8654503.1 cupin domain-containing protein [Novosphingobium album (ex Liu et al. 2023)]